MARCKGYASACLFSPGNPVPAGSRLLYWSLAGRVLVLATCSSITLCWGQFAQLGETPAALARPSGPEVLASVCASENLFPDKDPM